MSLQPLNGLLSVNGLQLDVPTGTVNIGPYAIPFSSVVQSATLNAPLTNQPVPIPAGCRIMVIVPTFVGNNATFALSMGWATGQVGRISPLYPTTITFDQENGVYPANLYLTAPVPTSGSASVTVIFA